MKVLEGKAAIVTGAARGIGKGMATALVKAGAAVTITDVLAETLEDTKNELQRIPGARVLAFVADGRNRELVDDVVRRTAEHFGRIDLLINNAQTAVTNTPIEKHTVENLASRWSRGFTHRFTTWWPAFLTASKARARWSPGPHPRTMLLSRAIVWE